MTDKTTQDLFDYLEKNNDDDLPDGAWWTSLEFAISRYNDEHGTDYHPSDMIVAWIKQR